MIKYKINVLEELKNKGYNSNRMRKENIMGQSYIQQLRNNELVSYACISKICELLECQIGDILEYVKEERTTKENEK